MAIPSFLHIGLNCVDTHVTESFYKKYFGFSRSREIDIGGKKIVFLSAGAVELELFQADGGTPARCDADGPAGAGFRHIAFQVDDIDAKLSEMREDTEITLGPIDLSDMSGGWKIVWVRDPDGRILEISQGGSEED